MQCIDLIALSFLPAARHKLAVAVWCADADDGRLETALDALDQRPSCDPAELRRAASNALETATRLGLTYVPWGDPDYPAFLAVIPDPPIGLWVLGRLPDAPSVAIIGSRAASSAALEIAHGLAAALARRGVCIVSGLARGCDGRAHQGAVDAGGQTVAVLGSGVDLIYPSEHQGLADAIVGRGAIVSEFPPGTPPLPHHFPLRNRIISGLSRAVIVVEAGEKSGSLVTAGCALEQGREVMVVPGPVLSGRNRGAHALLRDGATLVESAEDVLRALAGMLSGDVVGEGPLRGNDANDRVDDDPVLAALDLDDARDLDDLVARTGMAAGRVLARLTELELTGQAGRQPGGRFVRRLGKVVT